MNANTLKNVKIILVWCLAITACAKSSRSMNESKDVPLQSSVRINEQKEKDLAPKFKHLLDEEMTRPDSRTNGIPSEVLRLESN